MDGEIYVDRIVDMLINDVNAMLEVARKKALERQEEKMFILVRRRGRAD